MKKIKLIIPVISCLLATSLFSCANNNEQPESDYYRIGLSNSTSRPSVKFEGSNLVKKGEACDVFIRFEPYTELRKIDYGDHQDTGKYIILWKANQLSFKEELSDKCYTFTPASEDLCLWELKISKEYMTCSYEVDLNSRYISGYKDDITGEDKIKFAGDSTLKDKAELTVVNASVDSDYTFFVTPKNFQSGYTFDDVTKNAIKIDGVTDNNTKVSLTEHVTRNELVLCDSPIQGLGHYQTRTKQLRIAIPMSQLYEPDYDDPLNIYGYKERFDHIEISSTETDDPVAYNTTDYENIFNPTADFESCERLGVPFITPEDDGVHYKTIFKPKDGYSFPDSDSFDEENFPITDLSVLPGVYTPTGHPYFREFEVHKDESKQSAIKTSPYKAYIGGNETMSILLSSPNVLEDTVGNIYVPMGYNDTPTSLDSNYWLDVRVVNNNLEVDINITDMVKYVEFPTTTIIVRSDILAYEEEGTFYKFYQDGSIDFIQSVNFTVQASQG